MTPLTPTNLIAVPVTEDATDFRKAKTFFAYNLGRDYEKYENTRIENFKILGTVTSGTIDFDPFDYVGSIIGSNGKRQYNDYIKIFSHVFEIAEKSFRSLLTANDVLFENPYGKTMPFVYDEDAGTDREHLATQWQTAQSKVNKKYLILEKI